MSSDAWVKRLDATIHRLQAAGGAREIESSRLMSVVQPPSSLDLANAVAKRLSKGELQTRYRVVSRQTGVGIAEYPDILDVPLEVLDPTVGANVRVDPTRDIEIVFQTPKPQ